MTRDVETVFEELLRPRALRPNVLVSDDAIQFSMNDFWDIVDSEQRRLLDAAPEHSRVHVPMRAGTSPVTSLSRVLAVMLSGRSALLTPEDWSEQMTREVIPWCAAGYGVDGLVPWKHDPNSVPVAGSAESAEAVVLFTSGSTGTPKGVRLTASALVSNVEAVGQRLAFLGPNHVLGTPLSLAHSFGLSSALLCLSQGWGLSATAKRVPDRRLAARWERDVSVVACVPFFLDLVARRRLRLGRDFVPGLQAMLLAGAGIDDARLMRLLDDWDGHVCTMYGLTEATARVAIRRHGDGAPSDSVGLPIDGVRVRILDESRAALPAGKTGRIAVSSPSAMLGYLGEPPNNSREILTHDIGHLDQFGNLTVVGRLADFLNFRGNRVQLTGVESFVRTLDGVQDCVVVAAEQDDVPAEFLVQLEGNADAAQAEQAIRAAVRPVGLVGHVRIVRETPRTASGKVRRERIAPVPTQRQP